MQVTALVVPLMYEVKQLTARAVNWLRGQYPIYFPSGAFDVWRHRAINKYSAFHPNWPNWVKKLVRCISLKFKIVHSYILTNSGTWKSTSLWLFKFECVCCHGNCHAHYEYPNMVKITNLPIFKDLFLKSLDTFACDFCFHLKYGYLSKFARQIFSIFYSIIKIQTSENTTFIDYTMHKMAYSENILWI